MENLGQAGHRRLAGWVFERLAHGHHVRAIRPVALEPAPLTITAPKEAELDHVVGIVVTDDQGLDIAQQNDAMVPVQASAFSEIDLRFMTLVSPCYWILGSTKPGQELR